MAPASSSIQPASILCRAMGAFLDVVGLVLLFVAGALAIKVMLGSFRGIAVEQPLSGTPLSEQRRLLRLARSGTRVDTNDGPSVRAVIEHQLTMLERINRSRPLSLLSLLASQQVRSWYSSSAAAAAPRRECFS